jgi:DNA-binding transcriptional MocR family regulator
MASPHEYNFTGGMPDPESFPTEGLIHAAARALREVGGRTLVRYPGDHGDIRLREIAAARFRDREGVEIPVSDIAITNGSMQAVDLVLRAFVRPGAVVVTEALTYMGTLGALRHYGARLTGVPVDEHGMDLDALEQELRTMSRRNVRPALIYTIPTNQNPTGANLSAERRQRLVALAEAYDIPILEDDCYGDIHFEAAAPAAMYGFAPPGRVIYTATFSKVVGPGLRLGYLVAPPDRMAQILAERHDAGTSALASVILAEFLRDNLWEHIAKTNAIVRSKRDALLHALARTLGDTVACRPPTGGLFAWVGLPADTSMEVLMQSLARRRVLCSRGRAFDVANRDIPYVRFSYGYPTLQDIEDGIALFAETVHEAQPHQVA